MQVFRKKSERERDRESVYVFEGERGRQGGRERGQRI